MSLVLLRRLTWRQFLLIAFESLLIFGAVVVSAYLRLGEDTVEFLGEGAGIGRVLLIAAVVLICLYFSETYDPRQLGEPRELFVRILQALGAASIILALVYYFAPNWMIGRGVFVISAFLVVTLIGIWRAVFLWLTGRVGPTERLLLIGTSAASVALARELHERRHDIGVEIVGFVDPDPARVGQPLFNPGVIGTVEDIPAIIRARGVDRVVVSLADARGKLPMERLLDMKLGGVTFDHLASVYEEYTGKIAVENLRPSWLIFSAGFRKARWQGAIKRAVDIAFSAIGLLVLSPLMLLVAAAVRLTSPGPAMYHQQRVGQHGALFTIHKFRSMRQDAEATTGAVWAQAGDSRITPVGRFLRRTRLDEMPQLWNVLRGDMSLVGPRPERPEFVTELTRDIPFYGQRHVVKPGLTGWAQVRYTYGASVEDALEKLQYDLFYIKNMSLALDLFIVAKTVKTVLMRRGAH